MLVQSRLVIFKSYGFSPFLQEEHRLRFIKIQFIHLKLLTFCVKYMTMIDKEGVGFMNNLKRIFSCVSVLCVCLLANMGIEAKAITTSPVTAILQNRENTSSNFSLFTLHSTVSEASDSKIADHYSHRSHYSHSSHSSHHSHYSSRY